MTQDRIEIFQDANYLVFSHGPLVHPCTIIGLSWRGDDPYHPVTPHDFSRRFIPDHAMGWGIDANFISFIPSRNCWYLAPEVVQAVAAINAVTAQTRVVTYGSSMGGYAAINLARALNADYFFAVSPMSTIFDPFMKEIGDFRFGKERQVLPQALDGIARGDSAGQRGLIVFDDKHEEDVKHAQVILAMTSAEAVTVSHSGHPSVSATDRIYPLRKILGAIVDGSLDVASIQGAVDQVVPNLPQTLAATFSSFDRFLDLIDHSPQTLGAESFQSAFKTLNDPKNTRSVTKAMIGKVAEAAVRADCWKYARSTFLQTIWQLGLAYESIGCLDEARSLAEAQLPERERLSFLARRTQ